MDENITTKIEKFQMDIRKRVLEECEEIRKADNPEKTLEMYVKNIRWNSPELSVILNDSFRRSRF